MVESDFILQIVIVAFAIFSVSFILKIFRQPNVIAYILGGIILGPYSLNLIKNQDALSIIGDLGIVLLLFFIGMEVCIPCILQRWKLTVIGTLVQVALSIVFIYLISFAFDMSIKMIILLGFVISLSSTAVILKILQQRNELNTRVGQNVIGIAIMQDIVIVVMLIIVNIMGGKGIDPTTISLNIVGGAMMIAFIAKVLMKGDVSLPFKKYWQSDNEMQIFVAFLLCFGMAAVSGFFGLSPALGAFTAGLLVASAKETQWVKNSLHSFYVIFLALFFVYVGTLISITTLVDNFMQVLLTVIIVLLANTFINMFIFRIMGESWSEAIYGGALLSQIGEFSFVLGAISLASGIIMTNEYNIIVLVIALSLFISPFWIGLVRKTMHIDLMAVANKVKGKNICQLPRIARKR